MQLGDFHDIIEPDGTRRRRAAMHNERMVHADFHLAPFTIAWEVTRACAYACVHCRADAQHHA
jgi:AdoMet-dependent heme synthase